MAAKLYGGREMWSIKEAADYYHVSTNWLYNQARIPPEKGGPPVYRIGSLIRFHRDEFIAWTRSPMNRPVQCPDCGGWIKPHKSHVCRKNRHQETAACSA